MKKMMLLVSCFAVALILSNVSVAQDAAAPVCPCPEIQTLTVPINYPGLSLNPREIRRTVRLDGRIATRQMRIETRSAVPEAQFPFFPTRPLSAGVAGDVEFAGSTGVPALDGPVVQTGRRNNSSQRVTSNNAPVINFLSLVRGPQPVHPPYYAPAQ